MYNNINVLLYLLLCDERYVLLKFRGGGGIKGIKTMSVVIHRL